MRMSAAHWRILPAVCARGEKWAPWCRIRIKASAMKRLNLFLRWMVRQDEVDPGGWRVAPRLLIVPLDVHMHRCARALGLTQRNAADMKTALDITRSLAKFCPEDPVKYDFCITRFGIRPDMDEKTLTGKSAGKKFSSRRRRA